MNNIYLILNETAHGKRFWCVTGDPDPEKGSNSVTIGIYGPATMGPDGYGDENDAAEALADLHGIDLDDPDTWPETDYGW